MIKSPQFLEKNANFTNAFEYLCDLLSMIKSLRTFRSSSYILLLMPVSQLKSYDNCVFRVIAPTLRGMLLEQIGSVLSLPLNSVVIHGCFLR